MSKKLSFVSMLVVMLALLTGCGTASATEAVAPVEEGNAAAGAGLKITGSIDQEMAWSEDEIRVMDTVDAEYTNKDGETKTYTGVSINSLLDLAGVKADVTTLVLVGDDGYEAEVALEELRACADCIIAFRDEGGFSAVLPGFSGKAQVKGIIEIRVE